MEEIFEILFLDTNMKTVMYDIDSVKKFFKDNDDFFELLILEQIVVNRRTVMNNSRLMKTAKFNKQIVDKANITDGTK